MYFNKMGSILYIYLINIGFVRIDRRGELDRGVSDKDKIFVFKELRVNGDLYIYVII